MARLIVSTWSLVEATTAMLRPCLVMVDPGGGDAVEVLIERAGDDPVVGLVGIERSGVTGTQLQGGGCFPVVGEPVQSLELLDTAVGAQLGEQAAAADALELARITDQREPPPVAVDEGDELVEGGCGRACRPRRRRASCRPAGWNSGSGGRSVRCHSWSSLATVSAADAGVALERAGRLRRRRDGEHDTPVSVEVVGGGGEHAGLAGAGRSDDQDEAVVAGDGGRGVGLQRIQPVPVDRGGRCGRVGLGGHRPRHDRFLLGEHRLGREAGCGRFDPHRAAVRAASGGASGRIEVDELGEYTVGSSLEDAGPAVTRQVRHGALHVADRLDHIGATPRRSLLRHRVHDVGDCDHVGWCRLLGGLLDAHRELIASPARVGGLALPPCRQIGGAVTGLA